MEKNSNQNIDDGMENTDFEKSDDKTKEKEFSYQSILTNTESVECEYDNKFKCNDKVMLVDEQSESKNLNKLNNLISDNFNEEDFIPNKLNISNPDVEMSNLKESKLDHFQNLKNNLNQFDQNVKIIDQKDKIFLPLASITNKNSMKAKSNSLNDIDHLDDTHRSILNTDDRINHIFTQATILNRNNLSHSSSLSSSYSNINSNPNKSSSNSLTNHLELKFNSQSSIEDNSKFNLNTSALTESTILVSENKNENMHENKISSHEATIWSETEAMVNQFDQIGPSACGCSAILNVLKALNFEFDLESVCSKVKINSRIPEQMASVSTLAKYLFSRSKAGMNERELIENIERSTDSKISGRFFNFYPRRDVHLPEWLAYWIRKGAVPVALLNLQISPVWGFVPDAWHHQMIYACNSEFIYLTNPLESKSIDNIMNELTSESILLVRSNDVVKRFLANRSNLVDLLVLNDHSNEEKKRWYDLNVLGQVLNVLREHKLFSENEKQNEHEELENQRSYIEINYPDVSELRNENSVNNFKNQSSVNPNCNANRQHITHISIPASYKSGITLFAYRESELFKEILSEKELSMLE